MQKTLKKLHCQNRKKFALMTAFCIGMNTAGMAVPRVHAADAGEKTYIIMTEGSQSAYDVLEDEVANIDEDAIVQDNVAVVELTKKEADKLEKLDEVLYVEEDILLDGSDYEEEGDV
ncbi:MAG: hypothetical protein K2G89_08535, partial [Lachnospiraceae bacterium]|nr:hypothetical protein [Lachnospiraceae bacterium]